MIRNIPAALGLFGILTMLAACDRQPQNSIARTSDAPQPSNAPAPPTRSASPAEMVKITGGRFLMGDKEEVDATPHEVAVSSFYIDKYLVTQEQYEKATHTNPSRWKVGKNPVEQVRWSDAVTFCNKRSEMEGLRP